MTDRGFLEEHDYEDFYERLSLGLGPGYMNIGEQTLRDLMKLWDDLFWENDPDDFYYCAHLAYLAEEEDYMRWAQRLLWSTHWGIAPMIRAYFEGVPLEDILA